MRQRLPCWAHGHASQETRHFSPRLGSTSQPSSQTSDLSSSLALPHPARSPHLRPASLCLRPSPPTPRPGLVALSAYLPLTRDRNVARVGDGKLLAAWPCPANLTLTPLALPGSSGQQVSDSLVVDLYVTCHKAVGPALATELLGHREEVPQGPRDQPLQPGVSPRPTLHGEGLATACLAISKDAHWIAIQR